MSQEIKHGSGVQVRCLSTKASLIIGDKPMCKQQISAGKGRLHDNLK